MKRLLATVLLFAFSLQPLGAATTQPISQLPSPSLFLQMQFAAQSLLVAYQSSAVGSLLSGNGGRYAAMHAPAPIFPRVAQRTQSLPSAPDHRYDRKVVQYGVTLHPCGS